MKPGSSLHIALSFVLYLQTSLAVYYPLHARQCKVAVERLGEALSSKESDTLYKGTFVSARCELRRIQSKGNELKTSFLLRSIDIQNRRRWIGNYYFYRDENCMHPTYGLEIKGKYNFKNKILSLNLHSLSIAAYNSGTEREIIAKYNRSCPANYTKSTSRKTTVYTAHRKDLANKECLKALGVGKREFSFEASFETVHPKGGKSDELFQTEVDLTRHVHNNSLYGYQWPLVRHNTPRCLTCARVGLSELTVPPKLYFRNATSINGAWASVRCLKENEGVWTVRYNTFDGNKFDFGIYQMDYTRKASPHRCERPLFELHAVGTFRLIGDSIKVPGGAVYELYQKHAFLTPRHRTFEQIFNAADKGTCGKNEWDVGRTQDVTSTGGCAVVGYDIPKSPNVYHVLIRTVRDEGRNEMYVGYETNTKSGPLSYSVMLQSCDTYPIKMTTTPGPTYTTTLATEPAIQNDDNTEEGPILIREGPVQTVTTPTSNAVSRVALLPTLLVCLLLYLQTIAVP